MNPYQSAIRAALEAQGRIHTSTATVAVLPEVDEVDVDINWNDVRIDIFHSGGAGVPGVSGVLIGRS